MKVKSKLNGYPARRRAIQNVKDRFYFLFRKVRARGLESSGPLWGVALTFFILFQACDHQTDNSTHPSQQSYVTQVQPGSEFRKTGSLLFYTNTSTPRGFGHDYLKHGYQDDLYLRNLIPNSEYRGKVSSTDQAFSANVIHAESRSYA